jgi:NADH dehydrogenase FAD-containing subunit
VKSVTPNLAVTLIHSRPQLLSSEPLTDEFKRVSLQMLQEMGVHVILERRVVDMRTTESNEGHNISIVTLQDGEELIASHSISAISGSTPTTSYLQSDVLDEAGFARVNNLFVLFFCMENMLDLILYRRLRLQSSNLEAEASPFHYAAGDIVCSVGIKRCGSAMAMGETVAFNIIQHILQVQQNKEPDWKEWPEMLPMIALAIGDKAAVYDPVGGLKTGEYQKKLYFGNDMGLSCKFAAIYRRSEFLISRRLSQRHAAGRRRPSLALGA